MASWGYVTLRSGVILLGIIALTQPVLAEEPGNQPETSEVSVSASTVKGIELAGVEVAAQSTAPTGRIKPSDSELRCLAEGIYFEARGESFPGQLAVGQVIMNRMASDAYPDTICGVVYQNEDKHNRCQFSFACDGKDDTVAEPAKWEEIEGYAAWLWANDAKAGDAPLLLASLSVSTHYHADYVNPRWAKHMTPTGRIGRHFFYYDPKA
jgi:spore germination cell wall hydrolase CwlJ-like protein